MHMLKRAGGLGRAVGVAVVGIVFGLGGVVGESFAQSDMKKDDTKKWTTP
jgi:Pyruvate/2-oxoacid:ferredoxin oxidoreductase gamma subunit